jgi:AcrR family transcriptional regulator
MTTGASDAVQAPVGRTETATREGGALIHVDGRRLRSERTRRLMINQAREFMRSGYYRPASHEIAKAADVSVRSIFQHFPTMGDLYAAALDDEALAAKIAAPARMLGDRDLARAIVLGAVPT